jgi:hypothetical protein
MVTNLVGGVEMRMVLGDTTFGALATGKHHHACFFARRPQVPTPCVGSATLQAHNQIEDHATGLFDDIGDKQYLLVCIT